MSLRVWFATHADVEIDPAVPVPDWGLNARGRARHEAFAETWAARPAPPHAIWSSAEQKARDGAGILAARLGMTAQTCAALHENDRSATGYLAAPEFDRVVDQFFAAPDQSVRGWETARAAQARILTAVSALVSDAPPEGDLLIIAHGGVGTLLMAARLDAPISRALGPGCPGGGAVFAFTGARGVLCGWRPIDAPDALVM